MGEVLPQLAADQPTYLQQDLRGGRVTSMVADGLGHDQRSDAAGGSFHAQYRFHLKINDDHKIGRSVCFSAALCNES